MKPILFDKDATTFTSYGLGVLGDVVSCKVTEERNGAYELEMEYPIDGIHYEDIKHSCIIYAKPFDGGSNQPFRIYHISKPINGIVTVNAEHISYQLVHIPCNPFEATSIQSALQGLKNYAVEDCPFEFWTDKSVEAHYTQDAPASIRSRLGGTEGSILDLYGGEYEWDGYTVKLYNNRGSNNGVVLRYGKNITNIQQEENISNTVTGIVPFYKSEDVYVKLPEDVVYSANAGNFPYNRTVVMDFSSEFTEVPTVEQLRSKAESYVNASGVGVPKVDIKVSFVALWQTEEYKDIAVLERVKLCDTITVVFEKLGVEATAKVIKTVYDSVLERYESIEIGDSKTNMSTQVSELRLQMARKASSTDLERAISTATDLITGGLGGHVVFKRNANGQPEEILVMDTDNVSTAVNVIRINQNGIGFSNHGYNGPFRTAWTIDGAFVADFITSGTLSANFIKGGVLSLGGEANENGQIYIYDSTDTQVGVINNNGIAIYSAINQKQVLISPIVGFVERDASSGQFEGLVYEGYIHLPAYSYEKQRNTMKGVDNDTRKSAVIGRWTSSEAPYWDYAYFKYWYEHSSSYWALNSTTYPDGTTSVTVQLPNDFKGKNFSVSIGLIGRDSQVANQGYVQVAYDHNVPGCKADGTEWSETAADAEVYHDFGWGYPTMNNSPAYEAARNYQGSTPNPHFASIPNDYTTAVSLAADAEITESSLSYTTNQAAGTITITGKAKIGSFNYNEFAKIRVLAIY